MVRFSGGGRGRRVPTAGERGRGRRRGTPAGGLIPAPDAENPFAGAAFADEPAVPEPRVGGLVRLRLDIAYDGTDFAGWADQPGQRTVQAVLEGALGRVLREGVRLTVAGRTDAGVHATGQVAHLDVPAAALAGIAGASSTRSAGTYPMERLVRRMARLLPTDVRIRRATAVPAVFDARFSALRRHYRYRVADAAYGADPLRRRDTLAWPATLDVDAMRQAAAGLVGERDFAAYCRRREGATTVRCLTELAVHRPDGGALVVIDATADAFCHQMMRSIVGALLTVGDGRRPYGWPASLLEHRQRAQAVSVAAARGLTLVGVDYPGDDALADRMMTTRRLRGG